MYSKIWSRDAATGVTKIWHYDPDTDMATIQTQLDVEPLIEANKYLRRLQEEKRCGVKFDPNQSFHLMFRLPLVLWFELKRQGILGGSIDDPTVLDDPALAKWLNDSDNEVWRVHEGKI